MNKSIHFLVLLTAGIVAWPAFAAEPQQVSNSNSPALLEGEQRPGDGLDASVAGRPFPLSGSIVENCKEVPDRCSDAHKLLSKMASEPRDPAWAERLERMIQDWVTSQEPGEYALRSLECRQTVCAAEVTSKLGRFHDIPKLGSELGLEVFPGLGITGHEKDASGAWITVTLVVCERR